MADMADTLLGKVLDGRYRLLEVLSDAGPSGVIYQARDEKLGRRFAVKVFRDPASSAFEEAAKRASAIRHPNVEPVHDYGRIDDGRPYVVRAFLDGESLAERMERGLGQLEVLALLRDTCAGLAEAHAADLVHGSLKPENLFFESHQSGETLKIVDFDLPSHRASHSFLDDEVLDSAAWISPEQAKGRSAEPASDLYALGSIAYTCIAEQPPFGGEPHVVLSKKIDAEPTPLRELPHPVDVDREVDELILGLVAREPHHRPAARAAAEQAEALHAELAVPPPPQASRSRVPWFGIAATLMGAAALFVAGLRAPHSPRPVVMPSTGSITLESEPSGAHIWLDGEPLLTIDGAPAVTPADVQSLLYGRSYRLQLRKKGYVTWETEVAMDRSADGRTYGPELDALPAELSISAAPGSLIFVDELAVGRTRWEQTVQPNRPYLVRATSPDADCEERQIGRAHV